MKKVYLITTGHGPREDISEDLKAHFSPEIEVVETGALEEFTPEEVYEKFAPREGKPTLVARFNDGKMAPFDEELAMPYIQKSITEACEGGADAIIILCTSEFPKFESSAPILYPGDLLHVIAQSTATGMKTSYVFPFATHAPGMQQGWAEVGLPGNYTCWHHSTGESFDGPMQFLKEDDADFIIMDCIGYSFDLGAKVSAETGKPVLLPRAILVSLTHTLLGL